MEGKTAMNGDAAHTRIIDDVTVGVYRYDDYPDMIVIAVVDTRDDSAIQLALSTKQAAAVSEMLERAVFLSPKLN